MCLVVNNRTTLDLFKWSFMYGLLRIFHDSLNICFRMNFFSKGSNGRSNKAGDNNEKRPNVSHSKYGF
jgi:hypothetical protein